MPTERLSALKLVLAATTTMMVGMETGTPNLGSVDRLVDLLHGNVVERIEAAAMITVEEELHHGKTMVGTVLPLELQAAWHPGSSNSNRLRPVVTTTAATLVLATVILVDILNLEWDPLLALVLHPGSVLCFNNSTT